MNTNVKKSAAALIIGAAILMMFVPVLTLILQGQFLMRRETAFLGRVHKAHPEWEAEILQELYADSDSAEEIDAGKQVFLGNGYTEKGPGILRGRLMQKKALVIGVGISALLTAALVFLLLRLQRQHRAELLAFSQEKKALTEQLSELTVQKKQNERLHEFIENIAHQIKTPLSRAITSMELLKDFSEEEQESEAHLLPDFLQPSRLQRRKDDEKKTEYSERVTESIAHLEGIRVLVERLLTIGRMEAGEVLFISDPISLPAVLSEVLSEIPEESRPVLTIKPEDASFIWNGSYSWMREALRNLIGNCIEHGKSDKPVEIMLFETEDEYRITIRDYGPGFAEEDLPNIFDRFYRPQDEKKGHVGLGLNLAKLIIEGQKGELTAGNHPEGGAVFTLFLPRFKEMK